ncbi:esterase [Niabella soli DSM 19437]|uniref:Esterase n=1 Tax=Niabella soli DSM 19437 TaxID=929713 RepID=W0F0B2_9BACT|nr:esterase [Niabella soli DSM 19437]
MLLALYGGYSNAQVKTTPKKGTVVRVQFKAPSITGNPAGEASSRHLTIYLPPEYQQSAIRYPVIYFLHGMVWTDSSTMLDIHFDQLLDAAIANKEIPPVILVLPDANTTYKGSWYTNSALTGNWTDFIAKDVVTYVDQHYRTIPSRNSRGLSGISMGGHGALKVAMLYPRVFGAVYAMTPAVLNWSDSTNTKLPDFKAIQKAQHIDELNRDGRALVLVDLGRSFSPNLKHPPFYTDMPVTYSDDVAKTDSIVIKEWNEHLPTQMLDRYADALKTLNGLKIDWGRNDLARHVPGTCLEFSKKLEKLGVKHFAEAYLGGHSDRLSGMDGRVYTDLLPFFKKYLKWE